MILFSILVVSVSHLLSLINSHLQNGWKSVYETLLRQHSSINFIDSIEGFYLVVYFTFLRTFWQQRTLKKVLGTAKNSGQRMHAKRNYMSMRTQ